MWQVQGSGILQQVKMVSYALQLYFGPFYKRDGGRERERESERERERERGGEGEEKLHVATYEGHVHLD